MRHAISPIKRDLVVCTGALPSIILTSFMLSRSYISEASVGIIYAKVLIGLALATTLIVLMISIGAQVHVNKLREGKGHVGLVLPQTFLMTTSALMLLVPILAVPNLQNVIYITIGAELTIVSEVFLCSIAAVCFTIFANDVINKIIDLCSKTTPYTAIDDVQNIGQVPLMRAIMAPQ